MRVRSRPPARVLSLLAAGVTPAQPAPGPVAGRRLVWLQSTCQDVRPSATAAPAPRRQEFTLEDSGAALGAA